VDVLEQWQVDDHRYCLIVEEDGSISVLTKWSNGPWEYCSTGKQCEICLSTMPVEALETALDEPETSAPQTVVSTLSAVTLCVDYEPVTYAATFVGPEPEQDEPEGPALGNYPDRRTTVGEKVGDFFFNLSEWADGWRF